MNEKQAHIGLLLLLALGGGALLYCAFRSIGPAPAWGTEPPAAEGRDNPEPDSHCVAAHEHLQGVAFLPHRYPRECGMNVTAVVHHGYSGIRIPEGPDARWMTSPPSEAMF